MVPFSTRTSAREIPPGATTCAPRISMFDMNVPRMPPKAFRKAFSKHKKPRTIVRGSVIPGRKALFQKRLERDLKRRELRAHRLHVGQRRLDAARLASVETGRRLGRARRALGTELDPAAQGDVGHAEFTRRRGDSAASALGDVGEDLAALSLGVTLAGVAFFAGGGCGHGNPFGGPPVRRADADECG